MHMDPLEYEVRRWREYAAELRFAKPEDAEKDYLMELLLAGLFDGSIGNRLVFRGGTAISKVYGSGRFSEDLDFITDGETAQKVLETHVSKAMAGFNLRYEAASRVEKYRNMLKYTVVVRGPIYAVAASEQAKQTIGIDMNLFERPMMDVRRIDRVPIYDDARPYTIIVPAPEELLADKAKAMLERTEPVARDLYDAWFLSKKYDIRLDREMVSKKMSLYGKAEGEAFSMAALSRAVRRIGRIWDREMKRLVLQPPSYTAAAKGFMAACSRS